MSVQLGNDFRYLASQMLQCEPDVAWPAREEAAAGYVAAASIAYKTYQVQEQLKLQSIFAETNHFADLSEDQEYQRAESAVAELLHLCTDGQPLVDDHLYHELVGALVETVSVLAVDSVLAMEDITEVESQRIESLMKGLESMQRLFRNDNLQLSSVATFAPHWLKMCYTTELLVSDRHI
ncbi:hypothetical protein A1Q1_01944 [Trichosporon asahii var. asahii CBS 2479]|uniref:Uncharacterized protein n=1 Tax=Trichosporon asahii var. asahii (strain ATCC 90039 / CBS 2479 / JCM 2466 / KCTC 7840 / NBRC 103889/ NCYC 2677 / UAMH 7654) TaxID=1186058 RepID=J4UD08_TRIAS|nr:hypothetical protein A1Q1_01944 [Trichosporon asahii var. asahii CBS 2479]EJT48955.1 hypothetical protein A1Q1_01944 [Trichosporon asahii var. asahii CBS 2479]